MTSSIKQPAMFSFEVERSIRIEISLATSAPSHAAPSTSAASLEPRMRTAPPVPMKSPVGGPELRDAQLSRKSEADHCADLSGPEKPHQAGDHGNGGSDICGEIHGRDNRINHGDIPQLLWKMSLTAAFLCLMCPGRGCAAQPDTSAVAFLL